MTTANGAAVQADTPADADDPQAAGRIDDQDAGHTDEGGDPTPQGETDSDQGTTEAKLRKRAQRAEAERDELRALLKRQRQDLVDASCELAGLSERHRRAAEIEPDSVLTDDGLIDLDKLSNSVASAVAEFGLTKRRAPAANPQQGAGGGMGRTKASWADALAE